MPTSRYTSPAVQPVRELTPNVAPLPADEIKGVIGQKQQAFEQAEATELQLLNAAGVDALDSIDAYGQNIPVDLGNQVREYENVLRNEISTFADEVAKGDKSSSEYHRFLQSKAAQLQKDLSPTGMLGMIKQQTDLYNSLKNEMASNQDLIKSPWLANQLEDQFLMFSQGFGNDPNQRKGLLSQAPIGEYIDRNKELNEYLTGMKPIVTNIMRDSGLDYKTSPDGRFIISGESKAVGSKRIQEAVRSYLQNSPIVRDIESEARRMVMTGQIQQEDMQAYMQEKLGELSMAATNKFIQSDRDVTVNADPFALQKSQKELDEPSSRYFGLSPGMGIEGIGSSKHPTKQLLSSIKNIKERKKVLQEKLKANPTGSFAEKYKLELAMGDLELQSNTNLKKEADNFIFSTHPDIAKLKDDFKANGYDKIIGKSVDEVFEDAHNASALEGDKYKINLTTQIRKRLVQENKLPPIDDFDVRTSGQDFKDIQKVDPKAAKAIEFATKMYDKTGQVSDDRDQWLKENYNDYTVQFPTITVDSDPANPNTSARLEVLYQKGGSPWNIYDPTNKKMLNDENIRPPYMYFKEMTTEPVRDDLGHVLLGTVYVDDDGDYITEKQYMEEGGDKKVYYVSPGIDMRRSGVLEEIGRDLMNENDVLTQKNITPESVTRYNIGSEFVEHDDPYVGQVNKLRAGGETYVVQNATYGIIGKAYKTSEDEGGQLMLESDYLDKTAGPFKNPRDLATAIRHLERLLSK